jgi:hypothetical protein
MSLHHTLPTRPSLLLLKAGGKKPLPTHPNQILLFLEWCELNRISPRTGRRILASDNRPVVTQLSKQRIGITVANNAAWHAARARK